MLKKDERGTVVEIKGKEIPRDTKGDPAFTHLINSEWDDLDNTECHDYSPAKGSVLSQFTPEEVVAMVNRYLYQTEYQRTAHRRRARAEAELFKEVKTKLKDLFNVNFANASEDQLEAATKAVHVEKKGK